MTSKKDQEQYWCDHSKPYQFMSASEIAEAFKISEYGKSASAELAVSFDKTKSHPSALARRKYAISNWELLKTCFSRELLLLSRHRALYIFRTCQVLQPSLSFICHSSYSYSCGDYITLSSSQVAFVGFVACTTFLPIRKHQLDEVTGNLYMSCLFFGLVHMMFNGFSELPILITRLPIFFKQRDNSFHPAWAYCLPSWLLRVPYSIIEAIVWSCVVYYSVGFSPGIGR